MEKTTLRKSYTSSLFVVDRDNINDFELLPNHRLIRESQVDRIYKALKNGGHFESQVVINQKGRKKRIIDGGHRINAIKRFLDEFPSKRIEVNMAVYDNLSDDQEMEIFTIWNKGIKQSPDDYLNMRKEEIPLFKLLEKEYPCKVTIYSPQGDGIRFKTLVSSYLGALLLKKPGSYDHSIDTIIEKAKNLGHKDYKTLHRFMEGFISVFGKPSKSNPFSSYALFHALMRVYHDNVYEQGEQYFWDKVKSSVYPSPVMRNFSMSGASRAIIEPAVSEMLKLLNKGKRSNMFILREKFPTTEGKPVASQ